MTPTKYVYKDENGDEVYTIHRAYNEEGKKFFYPTVPGRKEKNLDDIDRVPYNLVGIMDACDRHETVYVVEGEKCADDLIERGYAATTSAGGSKWEWPRTWADYFDGAFQVIVFPDNDEPGKQCAEQRARTIAFRHDNVKIVELPGLGKGEDTYDWFRIEGNTEDSLDRLVENAPRYELIHRTVEYSVEESLVAYLLRPGNENKREVIQGCNPDDFEDVFWRATYVAMLNIFSLALEPDVPSVALRMVRNKYPLAQKDIEDKLWSLFDNQYVFSAWQTWLNDLVDQSKVRSVSRGLRDLATKLSLGLSGDELLAAWDKVDLRRSVSVSEISPNIEEFMNVQSYYDWIIPGVLERQNRWIVIGGEGSGKSLLRSEWAVKAASGLHIFTNEPVDPLRCLIVDCENSANQLRRSMARSWKEAKRLTGNFWYDNLRIETRVGSMNLLEPNDRIWLESKIAVFRPDILFIGPAYKMYAEGRSPEQDVLAVTKILDDLRERYGCAVIIEAHAPHGNGMGSREMRVHGSVVWQRWPESHIGLSPEDDPTRFKRTHSRGDRVEIKVPKFMYWNPNRVSGFAWLYEDEDDQY